MNRPKPGRRQSSYRPSGYAQNGSPVYSQQPLPPAQPPTAQPPQYAYPPPARRRPATRRRLGCSPAGCGCGCLPLLLLGLLALGLLLFPARTNLLLIGIDFTESGALARSDTIILTTYNPAAPYFRMVSVPRDLWVPIPGYGENRINTAHFLGEAQQPGRGPALLIQTLRQDFGVNPGYYVRVRFEGFREIVNAMGGLDITLDEPMAGYAPGSYHLTGNKALAFARHRYGEDDFFRMQHGQLLLKAAFRQMLNPLKWWRIPMMASATLKAVDTNAPPWVWPRLVATLLRVGPGGIDNRTVSREMATPFTTSEGAQVLAPNWPAIRGLMDEVFK